jgi:hypothetical protein
MLLTMITVIIRTTIQLPDGIGYPIIAKQFVKKYIYQNKLLQASIVLGLIQPNKAASYPPELDEDPQLVNSLIQHCKSRLFLRHSQVTQKVTFLHKNYLRSIFSYFSYYSATLMKLLLTTTVKTSTTGLLNLGWEKSSHFIYTQRLEPNLSWTCRPKL